MTQPPGTEPPGTGLPGTEPPGAEFPGAEFRGAETPDDAAQRWREWAGAIEPRPGVSPGGLTSRAMALAGSSVIATLSVLLLLLGVLPDGPGGSARPDPSSALTPAEVVTQGQTGGVAGPACAQPGGDLLCWEKTRGQRAGQTIHDPLISTTGPGTLSDTVAQNMIDGDPQTFWVSAGDAVGGSVLLRFNEPVTVGAVGMVGAQSVSASSGPLSPTSPNGRVTTATWSFAEQDGSGGRPCGLSGDDFTRPVRQDLTRGTTMLVSPAITTCSVKVRIDQVRSGTGSGSMVNVAISELILRTG